MKIKIILINCFIFFHTIVSSVLAENKKKSNLEDLGFEPINYIFNCISSISTTISWNGVNNQNSYTLTPEIHREPKPIKIKFITLKDKGILQGNMGETPLFKLSENLYIETTEGGNIIQWKLIQGTNSNPTVLFQFKAYELSGPFSITTAYLCN